MNQSTQNGIQTLIFRQINWALLQQDRKLRNMTQTECHTYQQALDIQDQAWAISAAIEQDYKSKGDYAYTWLRLQALDSTWIAAQIDRINS